MTTDTYNPKFFKSLFTSEDRHFWFCARNQVLTALVQQLTATWEPGYRVLEVGCGTGNTLRVLETVCMTGTVIGLDLFAEGLRFAQTRVGCPLIRGDIRHLPFLPSFSLIGLFDVLEHLPDDVAVLRHLSEVLIPGGRLLLTVPAHMSLWSYFDEAAHHCRRYETAELEDKLKQAGFEVEYVSPFMGVLYPLVWWGRRWAQWRSGRAAHSESAANEMVCRELRIVPVLNGVLTWLLTREIVPLLKRRRLRWGTSLIAIARLPFEQKFVSP